MAECRSPKPKMEVRLLPLLLYGEVAEWLKAAVSKTVGAATSSRGFESHPLRTELTCATRCHTISSLFESGALRPFFVSNYRQFSESLPKICVCPIRIFSYFRGLIYNYTELSPLVL